MQDIVPYLLAANTLISIGAIVYSWLSSSGKEALKGLDKLEAESTASMEKIEHASHLTTAALSARCSMLEQSVAVLTHTVDHLPSSEITHRLEIAIARVEGRIETLTERLQPVSAIAHRMQDIALQEARS